MIAAHSEDPYRCPLSKLDSTTIQIRIISSIFSITQPAAGTIPITFNGPSSGNMIIVFNHHSSPVLSLLLINDNSIPAHHSFQTQTPLFLIWNYSWEFPSLSSSFKSPPNRYSFAYSYWFIKKLIYTLWMICIWQMATRQPHWAEFAFQTTWIIWNQQLEAGFTIFIALLHFSIKLNGPTYRFKIQMPESFCPTFLLQCFINNSRNTRFGEESDFALFAWLLESWKFFLVSSSLNLKMVKS